MEWGYQRPAARWKWAGVGLTFTIATAGLVLGILGRQRSKPGGELERDAFAKADASLLDMDPGNDVDPREAGNICTKARQTRNDGTGLQVNTGIADTCDEAQTWETISIAGYVGLGAGVVGLVVFTTLLFVHRGDEREARVRPHPRGLTFRF